MATWFIIGWIISGLISAWLVFETDPSMYTLGDAWVFHDDDVVAYADATAIDDWLVWCAYDGI